MASIDQKQIAKEIVIAMIQKDYFSRDEHPETKTTADMVAQVYKTILNAVSDHA